MPRVICRKRGESRLTVDEWVQMIDALGDDDVRLAEKMVEQENLDIEISYFRKIGRMISAFLTGRGLL